MEEDAIRPGDYVAILREHACKGIRTGQCTFMPQGPSGKKRSCVGWVGKVVGIPTGGVTVLVPRTAGACYFPLGNVDKFTDMDRASYAVLSGNVDGFYLSGDVGG